MKRKNKKNIILYSIVLVQFILFYSYLYGDILITTTHGMSFWDCLFSGQIRDYYKINVDTQLVAGYYSGNYAAGYDFLVYIIFAIWDFPLWLCKRFLGVAYPLNYLIGNIWAKSIILLFYGLTFMVLKKILEQFSQGYTTRLFLLMTTSIFVSAYLSVIGQYDIITVFFMVLGIYYLICDKKWLFILAFSVAIPTKFLAMLAFLPILLLYEKKLIKVLGYLVISMIPMLLFRVLIPMESGESNINAFMEFLFVDSIPVGSYKVSFFLLFYITLLLFCFFKKKSEDRVGFGKEVIYISFLAYVGFFAFAYTFPYWVVYMLPYLYLMICINKEDYIVNLLLETCMSFFAVIGQSFTFTWVFSSTVLNNAILGKMTGVEEHLNYTVLDFLTSIAGDAGAQTLHNYILQICWGVFIVTVVFFMFFNCPWADKRKPLQEVNCKENRITIYIVRLLCLAIVYAIPFVWMMV